MDKVLVTGATGVLGRRVAHALVGAGYDVTGVARTPAKRAALAARKVRPVELDLFDRAAVAAAVAGHDVVLHLATAIPVGERANDPAAWAENDRIRREGARHLVDAAIAAGVRRFVQESIAFVYADGGEDLLDESARVVATGVTASALDAEAETHRFTAAGRTGVALRFGQFYGHDSAHTVDAIHAAHAGEPVELGDPTGYRSCVTTDDAAAAVVAALDAPAGTYNVVDDRPLRRDEHVVAMARALGVSPPAVRSAAVELPPAFSALTRSLRVSNAAFRRATGWEPRSPSAWEGWAAVVRAWRRRAA